MINRYRESHPLTTVTTVKSFLAARGIGVQETWYENIEGVFLVELKLEGCNLFVCGKSYRQEYALASGYGKLCEVLLREPLFEFTGDRKQADVKTIPLLQADEDKKDDLNIFLDKWFKLFDFTGKQSEIKGKIIKFLETKRDDDSFSSLDSNAKINLDQGFGELVYGSNGIAVGNTLEEAMVHGLTKILERYLPKEIMKKNISVPALAESSVGELAKKLIKNIEARGPYKVKLKDFSLGLKIPAVGLVLINKETRGYCIKLGVHPNIDVALERCISRTVYGTGCKGNGDFVHLDKMVDNYINSPENLANVFNNGEVVYPYGLFRSNSAPSDPLPQLSFKDNTEMADYLVSLIRGLGYPIYFKQSNIMGLVAIHLIVPGMSEVVDLYDSAFWDKYCNMAQIMKLIKGTSEVRPKEAKYLVASLEEETLSDNIYLEKIFPFIFSKEEKLFSSLSLLQLKILLYLTTSNYDKALKNLNKYINSVPNKEGMRYYRCCRDLLMCKKVKEDPKDILKDFYDAQVIAKVSKALAEHSFLWLLGNEGSINPNS